MAFAFFTLLAVHALGFGAGVKCGDWLGLIAGVAVLIQLIFMSYGGCWGFGGLTFRIIDAAHATDASKFVKGSYRFEP